MRELKGSRAIERKVVGEPAACPSLIVCQGDVVPQKRQEGETLTFTELLGR